QAPGATGWEAGGGVSLLNDTMHLSVDTEGSFAAIEPAETPAELPHPAGLARNPRIGSTLSLEEGVIPGLSADIRYATRNITEPRDLVTANNSTFAARVNYRSGPAVISFGHTLRYDPYSRGEPHWRVTSGIESRITLF
ncbi:MAG: hypothetical protein ACOCRN_05355, partial [Spirochaetia bacterium]